MQDCKLINSIQGFPIVGGGGGEGGGMLFFQKSLPIKSDALAMGFTIHLKMKPSLSEKQTPSMKPEMK